MHAKFRPVALAVIAIASALAFAGCDQHPSAESAGRKIDSATDKMAAKTESAAARVSEATDDAAITAKVKAALLAEPGLKSLSISVDTKDSTVTLRGDVASSADRDRAKQVASNVAGVRSVVDELTIKAS